MATDTVLISHVVGKAWMRASDGTLVALREGMRVPADAHILTEEGASVTLQADGTPPVVIGENTDMVVTDDIAAAQPQPAEHAVTPPAADVAGQVLAALQAGEDPFEILDPTAAVLSGGEGGGFNFTRLASVLETTSPLGLAYPRPGVETPEFVQLGGVAATADDTAAPVPAGPTINVPDINDIPGGDEQAPVTVPGNFTISETDTETGIVGTFSFSAAGGLQALIFNFSGETGTSGGAAAPADAAPRTVTLSDLQASATMPIEIDTDRGLLIINGYNTETGEVSYRYVSDGWQDHRQGDGESVFDTIGITVMDNQGRTVSSDLVANITDTTPEAQDDTVTQSAEDAPITIDALGNDAKGADGVDLATSVTHTVPQNGGVAASGTLAYNDNGTFTYTPGVGEEGTVTFDYTITDADGDESTATVTITLLADSVPTIDIKPSDPTAGDGTGSVHESGLSGGTAAGSGTTTEGTLSIGTGKDTLGKVEITDKDGKLVDVTGGGMVAGQHGTLTVSVSNGQYSYKYELTETTKDGVNDSDVFKVKVTDSDGDEAKADLTISIVDDVPSAQDDTVTQSAEDAPITIDALSNDAKGADGVDLATGVTHTVPQNGGVAASGTLAYNDNGTFTYTPGVGEEGTVTFDYTITDADGDESTATVTITLLADSVPTIDIKPSDPTAGDGTGSVHESGLSGGTAAGSGTTTEGTLSIGTGKDTLGKVEITDKDGKLVDVTGGGMVAGQHGTLTVSVSNGQYSYKYELTETTKDGVNDSDVFKVKVTDSDGDPASADLTISIVDDVPTIGDTVAQVELGSDGTIHEVSGTLDGLNFGADGAQDVAVEGATPAGYDPDDSSWTFTFEDGGELTISTDGSYTYTSSQPFPGDKTFEITVTDGDGDTDTGTLKLDMPDYAKDSGDNSDNVLTGSPSDGGADGYVNDTILGDAGGQQIVQQGESYNIGIMLDISGTMNALTGYDKDGNATSGPDGVTRYEAAVNALSNLLNSLEGHDNTINLSIVTFATYADDPLQITLKDGVYTYTYTEHINGRTSISTQEFDNFQDLVNQILKDIPPAYGMNDYLGATDQGLAAQEMTQWLEALQEAGAAGDHTHIYLVTDGNPSPADGRGSAGIDGDIRVLKNQIENMGGGNPDADGFLHTIGMGKEDPLDDYAPSRDNLEKWSSDGTTQFINNPKGLSAELTGGKEWEESKPMGSDVIFGGDGHDVIFGENFIYKVGDNPTLNGMDALRQYVLAQGVIGLGAGGGLTDAQVVEYVRAHPDEFSPDTPFLNAEGEVLGKGDVLIGGSGNDTLFGQDGNDLLIGDGDQDAHKALSDHLGLNQTWGSQGQGNEANVEKLVDQIHSLDADGLKDLADWASSNLGGEHPTGGGDQLFGGVGDDVLIGGSGDDTLKGGVGDDVLIGGAGNDTLQGGAGNDTLIGGLGDDVFVWTLGDQGTTDKPAVDHIADFGMGGGDPNGQDKLDLSELLQIPTDGNDLTQYLHVAYDSATHSTVINISTSGGVSDTHYDQQIIIDNTDLTAGHDDSQADLINSLIQQGKLQVDSNG